jgi:quercetin dioxygenase-like cupin family protein
MPFFDLSQLTSKELAPGVTIKAGSGEKMTLSHFSMAPGAVIPEHSHPHEQMGTVLKGRIELIIGEDKKVVSKGDYWLVPSNVVHQGRALDEASEILELFAPIREDYAPINSLT